MPMNPRLLRPRSGGVHPETQDWRSRVIANGGSVSGTTLTAVDRFVKAIHAAGIRDRFYRLNLFCGTSDASLNAVRTPLFRGPSLTGTQFGNATDTNVNFVQGDYAETGASGGLKGNGTTKYLETGFVPNVLTPASAHSAAYVETLTADSTANRSLLLAHGGFAGIYGLVHRDGSNSAVNFAYAGQPTGARTDPVPPASSGMFCGSAVSTSDLRLFVNGSQTALVTTARTTDAALTTRTMPVFCASSNGTYNSHTAARIRAYSLGIGLTASQALAYYDAMQAFQTALGRQV